MIKKIDLQKPRSFGILDWLSGATLIEEKINEIIDKINVLDPIVENIANASIQDNQRIMAIKDMANIHEREIDKLQMLAEPEKCDYDDTDDIAEVKNENLYAKSMRMEKEFAEEEMERLQKKLEIAVDALNKITNAQGQCWGATDTEIKFDCKHYASEALDEINNIDKGE